MALHDNLHIAKKRKDNEYYTQLEDVKAELIHYGECFRGKRVYLNCDNPVCSEFWTYFRYHFNELGLRSLTATYLGAENKYVYEKNVTKIIPLEEKSGDFRSKECVEILRESDIVVTNPPFSLFGEFINLIIDNHKDFLVLGMTIAVTKEKLFWEIQNNRAVTGYTNPQYFIKADGSIRCSGSIQWYTSLKTGKVNKFLELKEKYNPAKHRMCKNYDAVFVERLKHIPCDYKGKICVPLTFASRYNPEQFEILGMTIPACMPNNEKIVLGDEFVERTKDKSKNRIYANTFGLWYEDEKTGEAKISFPKIIIKNRTL
jgi:hypothetical protein